MQREFHWQVDLEHLVNRRYDAIVVTGTDRMIQWVSRGFRRMTGYAPEAVIGRKPSFLQGPLTDPDALQVLRDALQRSEPARIELVNYRSNGEAYRCVVSIEPLYNTQNEVTHFIAFEYATP